MPNIAALDRLKSQLLISGVQEKNQPLFQVINQLIDFLRQSITETTTQFNNLPPAIVPGSSSDISNILFGKVSGILVGDGFGDLDLPDGAIGNATGFTQAGDFYEEDTFTPVLGGSGGTSGQTYTIQSGNYVRVMRLIGANFTIQLSNKGTITTNCEIQGFPYTFEPTANRYYPLLMGYWANLSSALAIFTGQGNPGFNTATLYGATGGIGTLVPLTTAAISNTTEIRGFCLYRTLDK